MGKAKNVINELLVDVFNHILTIEEESLKKLGVKLSITEVHTLEAIRSLEEPTMTNVAKKLRVTTSTLTTTINRLVSKKYVVRYFDEFDRRKVLLKLTDSGKEILLLHDKFHNEMIEALLEDMQISDDDVLIQSLENISLYFKSKY